MADIPSIARQARSAARMLAASEGTARAKALALMADKLAECKDELLEANRQDLEFAIQNGTPVAFQKRLEITEKVFAYMLRRLNEASALPDPVGQVLRVAGCRMG
jgi:glutamate-5-semialdehyde dehydrogenase